MKVLLKDLLAVWFDCDEIKKYGEMMARNIFVLLFSRAAQKKNHSLRVLQPKYSYLLK